MSHKVLITGASGYLGGDFLARLPNANISSYDKIYALVRTDAQAEAVKEYGAEPLRINIQDAVDVRNNVVNHGISVVFYLVDPRYHQGQLNFIDALAEVKKETGKEVHFLHVSLIPKAGVLLTNVDIWCQDILESSRRTYR